MPYTLSNPPDVIKGLPVQAKRIWIAAFNSAIKEYKSDETKAFQTAWAAVQKAGFKKDKSGNWVRWR